MVEVGHELVPPAPRPVLGRSGIDTPPTVGSGPTGHAYARVVSPRPRLSLTRRGRAVLVVALLALAGVAWVVVDRDDPPTTSDEAVSPGEEPESTASPAPAPVEATVVPRGVESATRAVEGDPRTAVVAAIRALVERAHVLVVAHDDVLRQARGVAWRLDVPAVPASVADLPALLDDLQTEVVVHVVPAAPEPSEPSASSDPSDPSASPADANSDADPGPRFGDRDVRTVPVDGTEVDRSDLSDLRPGPDGPDPDTLVLLPEGDPARDLLGTVARATGVTLVSLTGPLPDSPDAIRALQAHPEAPWLAAGTAAAWSDRAPGLLAWDVPVVRRGVEVPGGGYRLFPGRRLVALYGSPGAPSLGVLGEQPLDAAIERARTRASDYAELVDEPVVPTFEIISTVATRGAGPDGDYSREIPVDQLRPWIERTADEDMYVILDLQPGRTDFLTQAKRYEELLAHPHVGLALDPEWRLSSTQRHLEQIGSVDVAEVQQVADWLAELTRREALPQKLLLLHQFRLSMLPGLDRLTVPPELAVTVQMDGQGPQEVKMATWRNVTTSTVPDDVWFGWKNFYDEDTTLRSPADTFGVEPSPVLVSYQ